MVDPAGPSLQPVRRRLARCTSTTTSARPRPRSARLSPADARGLPAFEDELAELAAADHAADRRHAARPAPAAPARPRRGSPASAARARRRRGSTTPLYLFGTSANQYLAERFESEHVKAALGWHAINDSTGRPLDPGTAFVLLHDHASEQAGRRDPPVGLRARRDRPRDRGDGRRGARGRRRDPHRRAGRARSSSRTAARPASSSPSGEQICAPRGCSRTPTRRRPSCGCSTRRRCRSASAAALEAYRCEGTSVKINLGVDRLPVAAAIGGDGVQPYHRGIMEVNPTVAGMDCRPGRGAGRAPAPRTRTSSSASLPCTTRRWHPRAVTWSRSTSTRSRTRWPSGDWDEIRDAGRRPRRREARRATSPASPSSIVARQVLAPTRSRARLGI